MSALTLLIIRHAEKPDEAWPGPGLTQKGESNPKSLVVRGWQRAGAWAARFGAHPSDDYPSPAVIYAADPKADDGTGHPSHRPFETVSPLAARLGLTIDTRWGLGQEKDLVAEVSALSGVVLIGWEHNAICGAILPRLVAGAALAVPKAWPGDRFDVVLRFDRSAPGQAWRFRQLCPQLLSGDSGEPIGA